MPWRWVASTGSCSTSPPSPTSRRTTSTSTLRWRTTSRPRPRCSRPARPPGGHQLRRRRGPTHPQEHPGGGPRRTARTATGRPRGRPACRRERVPAPRPRRGAPASVRLPGGFNVENAVCAIAALVAAGVPVEQAITGVAAVPGVPGRMERVDAGQPFLALVDYAHTPDAVSSLLTTVRPVTEGRVIVVLGCGGDRDRGKRPLMARRRGRGADVVVLTSDNPRSEDPQAILAEMVAGRAGRDRASRTDARPSPPRWPGAARGCRRRRRQGTRDRSGRRRGRHAVRRPPGPRRGGARVLELPLTARSLRTPWARSAWPDGDRPR